METWVYGNSWKTERDDKMVSTSMSGVSADPYGDMGAPV